MENVRSTTIQLPGPVDVAASFERFSRWGDDLLDRWDGETLLRAAPLGDGGAAALAIHPSGTVSRPALSVEATIPFDRLRPALERMVVTGHAALERLAGEDAAVASLLEDRPCRPVLSLDAFAHLVTSITAQQVNLRWAVTLRRRLVEAHGTEMELAGRSVWRLDPSAVAGLAPERLREMQFTQSKAEYITGLAGLIDSGSLDLPGLAACEDEEVIRRLTEVRGLGTWSAEWFLVRALGRPRVVAGDLGVRKAVGALYLAGSVPSESEVRALTSHWGDAAAVAQQLALERLYGPEPAVSSGS